MNFEKKVIFKSKSKILVFRSFSVYFKGMWKSKKLNNLKEMTPMTLKDHDYLNYPNDIKDPKVLKDQKDQKD